jgi:hypothetical protein
MKFRVEKMVYSDGTTKYYPQYRRWLPFTYYWAYMDNEKTCGFVAAVFNTEEEAWRYIRSKQNYPKVSYTYKENVE